MKLAKLPDPQGRWWWVVVHELTLAEGRLRKLRPIHAFTLLAQTLIISKRERMFRYCLALENKLFGVRYHQFEIRRALSEVSDPVYQGSYLREYDSQQKVICSVEAYLNAIYTSLELASQINKMLHPELPIGFRKQSKKFDAFDFSKWIWLPRFYDIRSQLEHFGTPLPIISEGKLLIEFTQAKQLEFFQKGKQEISFSEIFQYSVKLFEMLDAWATEGLSRVDQEVEIDSLVEKGLNSPLKPEKIKAKHILELLK